LPAAFEFSSVEVFGTVSGSTNEIGWLAILHRSPCGFWGRGTLTQREEVPVQLTLFEQRTASSAAS
jgi:hypothetical protein